MTLRTPSPPNERLVRLVISGPQAALEILSANLFDAGAAGIVEEPGAIVVYPQNGEQRRVFLDVFTQFEAQSPGCSSAESPGEPPLALVEEDVSTDWQTAWLKTLKPEKISATYTLRPTHCPLQDGEAENTLWFEPQASFGSGEHPTTRLAATWIEEYVSAHPAIECFDVGTGSGVLALVAATCGAEQVLACDIEPVSIASAEQNAALNELDDLITVALGSADITDERFPLVIANINTPILQALRDDLAARVAPGGRLMLTGLLEEDIPSLQPRFEEKGLVLELTRLEGEWALLVFSRASAPLTPRRAD